MMVQIVDNRNDIYRKRETNQDGGSDVLSKHFVTSRNGTSTPILRSGGSVDDKTKKYVRKSISSAFICITSTFSF